MITIPPGDLKIIKRLGKGGCGKVYLAESQTLGKVALKIIFLEGDDPIIKEFLKEAELLSQMNSPDIIRFYGISKSEKGECIVMKYAKNGSLYDYMKDLRKKKLEDTFSWDQRYKIAKSITRGLFCIHSKRVLHRDMKSLNILLTKKMKAKISDFGLSKIKIETQKTFSSLYVSNDVSGTICWKAPETFSIDNPYTHKADIYSLGIIFWEIASCQVPYEGVDEYSIMNSVEKGKRPQILESCPGEFKDLIERCWSHDPKHRPDSSSVLKQISEIKKDYQKIGKWKSTKAPDFESNIFEAAAKGKLTSIIYMLANGTNGNEKYQRNESYDGWLMTDCTPLHFSARYDHLSVVEYLVNQKADINAKNNWLIL